MKNIVIVSGAILVWGNSASVARMNNYAKALAQNEGIKVYLFSQKFFKKEAKIVEIGKNTFTTERPIESNVLSFCAAMKFVDSVKEFCRTLEGEIVFLFYPSSNPLVEVAFLLKNKLLDGSKAYCEINEVRRYASDISLLPFHHRIIKNITNYFTEKFVSHYDGLICISKNIEHYFFDKNKNTLVVPILADIPSKVDLKVESNKRIKFVFTGSVSIEKENLKELLKGLALFNNQFGDWEFLFYGNCSQNDKIRLKDMGEELGITSKVLLKGEIVQSEIPQVLSSADCLILPRRNSLQNYYGFSTKLSEYAISGRPIILTNTGVVADYFQDGVHCLMPEGFDAKDLFIAFNRFLSMSVEDRNQMGENAYEITKRNFDWRIYSGKLNTFLK